VFNKEIKIDGPWFLEMKKGAGISGSAARLFWTGVHFLLQKGYKKPKGVNIHGF